MRQIDAASQAVLEMSSFKQKVSPISPEKMAFKDSPYYLVSSCLPPMMYTSSLSLLCPAPHSSSLPLPSDSSEVSLRTTSSSYTGSSARVFLEYIIFLFTKSPACPTSSWAIYTQKSSHFMCIFS